MKNLTLFLSFLLSVVLFSYCKEDLVVDDSDKQFPLKLTIDTTKTSPQLSWEAANNSRFLHYILVRSTEPIPTGLKPTSNSGSLEIIVKTNQPDSLHFSDLELPLAARVFYKIYVEIEGRFLESPAVSYRQPLDEFDFQTNWVLVDADSSWAILGSNFDGKIMLYDFKRHQKLGELNQQNFISFNSDALTIGTENGKKVLYFWNSYTDLKKYELPSFNELMSATVSYDAYSLASNNNGLLFSTHYDYQKSLSVRKSTNLSTLKDIARPNYYDTRKLVVLDGTTNRVVEMTYSQLVAFNVNQTTGVLSNTKTVSLSVTHDVFTLETPVSFDRKFFIPTFSGQVYDSDLNSASAVPQLFNPRDYAFSRDGKSIIALSNDPTTNQPLVTKFKFPEYTSQQQIRLPISISPQRVVATENGVFFIGTNVNKGQTIIKKMDL